MDKPEGSVTAPEVESNVTAPEGKGSMESAPAGKGSAATPANAAVVDQPTVNYEAKFKELQRAYTQETQRRAAVEKQWGGVSSKLEEQAKILAELRKQPYDRDKFLAEFQDKGPDALKPYWEEQINSVKQEYSKASEAQATETRQLRTSVAVMERRADPENYPDFRKLEPVISELMDDPNCPVDFSKPIGEVLDVLYRLARQTNSTDAILEAEKAGAKKAEANLVRESRTTVTGGGKAASTTTPDTSKMSVAELREHMVKLNGVVDRD